MAKINKRLLPIKAHFLFFMGAMGPILPQLSVLGKQIGVSPEVMGYITSVLPLMYLIAKPLFGWAADYFAKQRKLIFMALIAAMTLSYGAFYFVPNQQLEEQHVDQQWPHSFQLEQLPICSEELLKHFSAIVAHHRVNCTLHNNHFEAYFASVRSQNASELNVTNNFGEPPQQYLCVPMTESLGTTSGAPAPTGTCQFVAEAPPQQELYGSFTFWFYVLCLCAGTIGFNVTNSISDAICFDMLGESEESKYGAQRVWGTIGFGATALLAGIVVDMWTTEVTKSFAPALIIMLVFSVLDLFSVSKLKLPKLSASESIFKDICSLVMQPPIAIFLLFATIAGIIDSFIIYFMFWHLEEVAAETGYYEQIKLIEGCVVAAECLAGEVPFFFYSGKIIKKLGYVHCMSMCFFFYAVRLALISWIPNPWYLVGVEFFLQGCTYALCYTCIVAYASAVAPPGTSATVQGLMAGMDDGLGFSIGSLIGGLAFKRFGGRRSFLYFAVAALCTCVAHIVIRPTSRKNQYLPKCEYEVPAEQITVSLKEDTKS